MEAVCRHIFPISLFNILSSELLPKYLTFLTSTSRALNLLPKYPTFPSLLCLCFFRHFLTKRLVWSTSQYHSQSAIERFCNGANVAFWNTSRSTDYTVVYN